MGGWGGHSDPTGCEPRGYFLLERHFTLKEDKVVLSQRV